MQNLLTDCPIGWAYVSGLKKLWEGREGGPAPWDMDVADPLETRPSPCVTMPNLIVINQIHCVSEKVHPFAFRNN